MIDPVSAELQQRSEQSWPWRWAVAAAVLLHVAVAGMAVLAPSPRRRPLTLPSVQVRMAALPQPAAPPAASTASRPAAPPQRAATAKPAAAPPTKSAASRKPPKTAARPPAAASGSRGDPVPSPSAGDATGVLRSGSLSVGSTAGASAEAFPFQYYLSRLLSLVEGNWFRPPASPGTACRVRCRIDRAGRLDEVGIEQASGNPAFDRAALRAVYACTPFPPLPQAYAGNDLTLHLEFGP